MAKRILTTISERQLTALYRVVCSMNLVGAKISVSPDELLSAAEMKDLEQRLFEPLRDSFPLAHPVELSVVQESSAFGVREP